MKVMNHLFRAILFLFMGAFVVISCKQNRYEARIIDKDGVEVAVLKDHKNSVQANIAVDIGNTMYQLLVNDSNELYFPVSLKDYQSTHDKHGNPFMYPWGNRLEDYHYYFNDQKINVDTTIPSLYFQRDGNNLPLHGYMVKTDAWKTTNHQASNDQGATHTAQIKFSEHPKLMKNYPFPHILKMTHTLKGGEISIKVTVQNTGEKTMPLAYGFHTYYKIPDMDEQNTYLNIPADKFFELDSLSLPTGNLKDIESLISEPHHCRLGKKKIDHIFTELHQANKPFATFSLQKPRHSTSIHIGSRYRYTTVYSPVSQGTRFICIEPMMAPTNGFNLYHKEKWDHLPIVKPGETQSSTFKITVP